MKAADSASRAPDTHGASRKKGLRMPKMREGRPLGFEWDENKRQAVSEERRIDFRGAVRIPDGQVPATDGGIDD